MVCSCVGPWSQHRIIGSNCAIMQMSDGGAPLYCCAHDADAPLRYLLFASTDEVGVTGAASLEKCCALASGSQDVEIG